MCRAQPAAALGAAKGGIYTPSHVEGDNGREGVKHAKEVLDRGWYVSGPLRAVQTGGGAVQTA